METNMKSMMRVGFPALIVALGLGGCAQIIGIEDTEITPGRDLSCVGRVVPPPADGESVEIRARITDISGATEVPGVEVVRCNSRLGAACDFGSPYLPNEEGLVVVPVNAGFNGFVDPFFYRHRICARGNAFDAFRKNRFRQNDSGCRSITCYFSCFGCNFFN